MSSFDKRERPSHVSIYRDAAFLSKCSEQDARDWLKDRPIDYSAVYGVPETPPESHVLEYILYRRNTPMIDLALAEHGRSMSVLERVYKRANSFTQVVACANPSLFVGDVLRESIFENLLWDIVESGSLAKLRTVCENPDLGSGFYASLVHCWEGRDNSQDAPDIRVSSERFKYILLFLSNNPRISMPREKSKEQYDYDGFADYKYTEFFARCWKLAVVVPVEPDWAFVLSKLYKKLYRAYYVFDDIEAVLNRWHPDDEKSDRSSDFAPFSHEKEDIEQLAGDSNWSSYEIFSDVREQIVAKFVEPSIEMLNNDDPAVRRAFYNTFDPEKTDLRDLDWTEWPLRDEDCDIWLVSNNNIWRSSSGRWKLRRLLLSDKNNDLVALGFFDQREAEYRKTYPEWFETEDVQEEYNDIGPDLAHRIENLERATHNLATTIPKQQTSWGWTKLLRSLLNTIWR